MLRVPEHTVSLEQKALTTQDCYRPSLEKGAPHTAGGALAACGSFLEHSEMSVLPQHTGCHPAVLTMPDISQRLWESRPRAPPLENHSSESEKENVKCLEFTATEVSKSLFLKWIFLIILHLRLIFSILTVTEMSPYLLNDHCPGVLR